MNHNLIMKYFSLCNMCMCAGMALGDIIKADYINAAILVIACMLNHVCYNIYSQLLKNEKNK